MEIHDLPPPHLDHMNTFIDIFRTICGFGRIDPLNCDRCIPGKPTYSNVFNGNIQCIFVEKQLNLGQCVSEMSSRKLNRFTDIGCLIVEISLLTLLKPVHLFRCLH